jgi:hypothetical protein
MKLDAAAKAELKASPRISAVRCKTWISARRPRYQYSGRSSAQRLRFKRYRPATTWKDLPYTCICMHRKDSRFMSNATRIDACHCGSSACSRRQHRLGMRRGCPIETGIAVQFQASCRRYRVAQSFGRSVSHRGKEMHILSALCDDWIRVIRAYE